MIRATLTPVSPQVFAAVLAATAAAPQFGNVFKKVTTVETARSVQPGFLRAPAAHQATHHEYQAVHHEHHAAGRDAGAAILEQVSEMTDPNTYLYKYKTENGIEVSEQSSPARDAGRAVQGAYSWVDPNNGEKYDVKYTADEMGFHAEGAHLPVAPPVPEAIARALVWIAAHPDQDEANKSDY